MKYDVVVVGAGPSGSTAAKNLAERGINVLLVDKEKFPRDKPCGGGLPIRTLSRFPYLKESAAIDSYSFGGFVYSPSMNGKTKILKTSPVLATVLRSTFDQDLVHLAVDKGVEFQDETRVDDIKFHSEYAQVFFKDGSSLKTNLIIGADGTHGLIARKSQLGNSVTGKGVCVLEEFHLSEKIIEQFFTSDRLCHIHSKFNGISGYGWVFPKKYSVNVGIVSYDSYPSNEKKINVNQIFNEYLTYLIETKILPASLKSTHKQGGVLPCKPRAITYSDRVLLCGDAAGLINPISGEGIYYALVSGELAGKIAARSIKNQNMSKDFLSEYQRSWKKDFGKDINIFLKSKKQWGKNGDRLINLMNKDPVFAEMVFLIMVGKESAYDLRWKLVRRYLRNLLF